MKNVLITGASGYIGLKLAMALSEHKEVQTLIGIDIRPPSNSPAKLQFIEMDIREPLLPLLHSHGIDTVVHAAYVLTPIHNKGLMEDINLSGTRNVLDSCMEANVSHLLYTSSTTAYGFHPDNEYPLTEESPLRGNSEFTYSKNKREIEGFFSSFIEDCPEVRVTLLRPCFVVGPGFDNPLARHLKKRFVLLPDNPAPYQFVHEDDLLKCMIMCLEKGISGVYNVAGDGLITFPEMVKMLGNTSVYLPYPIMAALNQVAWICRLKFLTEFPSSALSMIRYRWIASSKKLRDETGFVFSTDSRGAFQAFVDAQNPGLHLIRPV